MHRSRFGFPETDSNNNKLQGLKMSNSCCKHRGVGYRLATPVHEIFDF